MEQADLQQPTSMSCAGEVRTNWIAWATLSKNSPSPSALTVQGQGCTWPVAGSRRPLSTWPMAESRPGDRVGLFGGHDGLLAGDRACRHRKRRHGQARPAEISPETEPKAAWGSVVMHDLKKGIHVRLLQCKRFLCVGRRRNLDRASQQCGSLRCLLSWTFPP